MSEHYTIISADTHAGGSHEQYREYLDPQYRQAFDDWRGEYKNPWRDLRDTSLRTRNWDDDLRNEQQEADGVVGEVIFPNTVPPFFPSFVLFAPPAKPEEYELRHAGIQAHNRWLADFCSRFPERRAGVGQIFLNDVDDAIADAIWIKENGLRGGVLLPNIPPDVKYVPPLFDPCLDPLWKVLEELEIPVNAHGGTGSPNYGKYAVSPMLMISEVGFYSQRPLVYLTMSGVFARFPKLKFVMTELGGAWIPGLLKELDRVMANVRAGAIGELKYRAEDAIEGSATDYFHQNVWLGCSQPGPAEAAIADFIAPDRFMWGSDYPHDEGTGPYTREHLRQVFSTMPAERMRDILAGNAAKLYGFDLDALAPLAAKVGPTVQEIAQPLTALPENPNTALLRAAGQDVAA
ncbi:MAG: amidohydrolase family protein [Acidimicrobiia bacterium]|jgi:predicted TIM-barrel fold metal-dependent hydrolase